MDRLPAVLHVLHETDVEKVRKDLKAQGLLTQIDLTLIATLAAFKNILGDTKLLSDMLQASYLD